jgi:hypothetical protein
MIFRPRRKGAAGTPAPGGHLVPPVLLAELAATTGGSEEKFRRNVAALERDASRPDGHRGEIPDSASAVDGTSAKSGTRTTGASA